MKEKKILVLALLGMSTQLNSVRSSLRDNNAAFETVSDVIPGADLKTDVLPQNNGTGTKVASTAKPAPASAIKGQTQNTTVGLPKQFVAVETPNTKTKHGDKKAKAVADKKQDKKTNKKTDEKTGHKVDSFMRHDGQEDTKADAKNKKKGAGKTVKAKKEKAASKQAVSLKEKRAEKTAEAKENAKKLSERRKESRKKDLDAKIQKFKDKKAQYAADQKKDARTSAQKKSERKRESLAQRMERLEAKKAGYVKELAELNKQEEPEVRTGRKSVVNTVSVERGEVQGHIDDINAELAVLTQRYDKRTPEYKQAQQEKSQKSLPYYQTTDNVIKRNVKKLRDEKSTHKTRRHEIVMQEREELELLKKDTLKHEALIKALRDAETTHDKKRIQSLKIQLYMISPQLEVIDARISQLDKELGEWRKKQNENDFKYDQALKGAGQPSLKERRYDQRLTDQVQNSVGGAQPFTTYDQDLNDKAVELGLPHTAPVRMLPAKDDVESNA